MSASETASDASDTLGITLFGPMQVRIEGKPLPPLRSRKSLWLLALLTLRHDRPVERGWLAGTLWPDVNQTRASSNLRSVVSELRQALGSQAYRLQSPSRRTLRLDLTGMDVDVRAFDAAIGSQNLLILERAVALYRGPLLEGCTEEWVFPEREKREQGCLRALETLGSTAFEAGDYETAVGYYRRALGLDTWHETARRGLMEALARKGDRNTALQVYREYVTLLRETPHMAPDEETRAVYTRLRAEASQQIAPHTVAASASPVPVVAGYVPHALTELVGREEERLEVAACLRRSRLVTLTGVGGIGKTRLAMAVAGDIVREYTDGVWLVALDSLSEEQQVMPQIASMLEVKEEAKRPLSVTVTEYLKNKRLLLVLDNCEHLLKASAETVRQLLAECKTVRILTTSREALGITGEIVWTVPSLPAPDPEHLPERQTALLRVLLGYASVQLFVERAQAVQKTFALTGSNAKTVAQICYRLEGIPLAIELAAARVKVITVEQIAARLGNYLGLLTGGSRTVQARQQTLRATLDWSYALLAEEERLLLQRLSIFAGGWTREAAEAVCADSEAAETSSPILKQSDILPLLTALVDKSLISEANGRFRMLEMVRQFAGERLAASGEEPFILARHQDCFIALAEEAAPHLSGPEQAEWLRRLAADHDNLRAIFSRSEQGDCSAEGALRLAVALRLFWYIRGDYSEGRKCLTQVLEHGDTQARTPARARALNGLGGLVRRQGDYALAQTRYEESLSIRRELGDGRGSAETTGNLGMIQSDLGNYKGARAFFEESLSLHRQLSDKHGVAMMVTNLGSMALNQGEFIRARGLLEESLLIYRELGDRFRTAWALNTLGNVISALGDLIQAQALHEASLSYLKELGDRNGIAWTRNYQGMVAARQGDYARAQAFYQEGLSIFRDLGEKHGIGLSLEFLGEADFDQGEFASAHSLYQESLSIFKELGQKRGIASTLSKLGSLAFARGDDAMGRALFKECLPLFKDMGTKSAIAQAVNTVASAMQGRDVNVAVSLWGAAQTLRENTGGVMPLKEQEKYEKDLSQARVTLGEDAFVAAWEAGRALTWEQAADYALEKLNTGY
jgi:predicted ATPase/DNA-binding SARP family transcriptional activator